MSSSRALPGVFLLPSFVISLPAVTTRLYGPIIEYFAYLRSAFSIATALRQLRVPYFYDRHIARAHFFKETVYRLSTPPATEDFAPIGSAILWAPFYAISDVGVRIACAWSNVEAMASLALTSAVAYWRGRVRFSRWCYQRSPRGASPA